MEYVLRRRLRSTSSTGRDVPYRDSFHDHKEPGLYGPKIWVFVLFFYVSILLIVFYCDVVRVPQPLSLSDLRKSSVSRPLLFSEERARNFIIELSNIGPKPTGSYENEVLAVDYLLRQLNHIKTTLKPYNKIDIDLQKTTGCFPLHFKDGMTTCYENVKNIVAKIGPPGGSNSSLLINCHFDSVPTSPGSSDDIVNCAVMLEVLIALSQLESPMLHSVVFLFNGAEENILQAAHGFITQHKWAKDVVGFINLESCGAGGKQMMFQADKKHTWLVQAYAESAPYPQGSVVAQEIFQSGVIPSDTDYRIFKTFGGLPGLDFAFVKNGYVYHTKYDAPQFITPGSVQQAGENLLNVIHHSLSSAAMKNREAQPSMELVFFDFLGLFMMVYRTSVATIINVIVIIMAVTDMSLKCMQGSSAVSRIKKLLRALGLLLASGIAMLAVNLTIACILGYFNFSMTWYHYPGVIVGLYVCPALAVFFCMQNLGSKQKKKGICKFEDQDWMLEDVYFDSARIMWLLLLVTMQFASLNSSFICTIWILFPTLVRGISCYFLRCIGLKGSPKSHLFVHLIFNAIPLLVLLYCAWSMYAVFIPITGRIGALLNPDIPVALFTAFLVFLATSYMITLAHVTSNLRGIVVCLMITTCFTISLACFTSVGFPYSGEPSSPTPMRSYILHTERVFRDHSGHVTVKDSGYWVIPLDYNGHSMLSPYVPGLKDAQLIDCDGLLGCGVPFYIPIISFLRKSYWIPASKPKRHGQRKLKLVSHDIIEKELHRLSFQVTGPDHMTFFLSPLENIKLVEWSLYVGTPLPILEGNKRPTYFIYYSYGEYTEPWKFSIVLKAPKNYSSKAPMLNLSFITHWLHDVASEEFSLFLDKLPEWVHAISWACTLDMLII